MGMYLRITERRNRDGSTVSYYALAENIWNPEARRSETRVVHSFGRADQLDKAALQRLVASINRVIDSDAGEPAPTREQTALPEIDIEAVFEPDLNSAGRLGATECLTQLSHQVRKSNSLPST